eukprot:TRINITY_DN1526_c0_g1_i1.p1 TRINITY_DN1526_c0_g1~~TRINITY_DN1526_c0_g1_i1.p1  ORF type:complete len:181 (+),score=53.69 TRINITY_DN1526_c0_g1_i1:48-590(+)
MPAEVDSHTIEQTILTTVDKEGQISDTGVWAQTHNFPHDDTLVGSIKKLEALEIIKTTIIEKPVIKLSQEAEEILQLGSAEARVFDAIGDGIGKDVLDKTLGEVAKIGFGVAMKNQWVVLDKATNKLTRKVSSIQDTTREQLAAIKKDSNAVEKNSCRQPQKEKTCCTRNPKNLPCCKRR